MTFINKILTLSLLCSVMIACEQKGETDIKIPDPVKPKVNLNEGTKVSEFTSEITTDTSVITHFAEMKTSLGTITLALFGEDAPKAVENFAGLINKKYYNGILFHRVAKDFLIQTGDRNTRYMNRREEWGSGGESFSGEEFEDELNQTTPSYKTGYIKGVLAMANRGPNTNTSQFFICLEEAIDLEHKHTIFGKVISGMDVVEEISLVEVEPSERGADDGLPIKPIRILSMKVNEINNTK